VQAPIVLLMEDSITSLGLGLVVVCELLDALSFTSYSAYVEAKLHNLLYQQTEPQQRRDKYTVVKVANSAMLCM